MTWCLVFVLIRLGGGGDGLHAGLERSNSKKQNTGNPRGLAKRGTRRKSFFSFENRIFNFIMFFPFELEGVSKRVRAASVAEKKGAISNSIKPLFFAILIL